MNVYQCALNAETQTILCFVFAAIGIDCVLIFIAVTVRYAKAKAYFRDCKTGFVEDNKALIERCNQYGNSLYSKYQEFRAVVVQLGLEGECSCSSAAVSNVASDPIKFLIKHSKVQENDECLSLLVRCAKYTKAINVFYGQINEIRRRLESGFPRWVVNGCRLDTMTQEVVQTYAYTRILMYPRFVFSYVSPAGRNRRTETIVMNEAVFEGIWSALSSNMSKSAHIRKARSAMTPDLREAIKKRDNYTCKLCGNSVYVEPNLLLEVDHIIPVSKGGRTEASNLQTLCWRCNRTKGNKEMT
ncbi:MAG: HNH endonuclease [Clostridiales bacterium]|nr:HNH endonuclease [Clostridiales bacterium]